MHLKGADTTTNRLAALQVAALPWRLSGDRVEILLITSRDTGRWVLPKGWPENGETLWDAAAREAMEEAGVSGKVSSLAAGRYDYPKRKRSGKVLPCAVTVHPLQVTMIADDWKERAQRTRKWFHPGVAAGLVNEPGLRSLLRKWPQHKSQTA